MDGVVTYYLYSDEGLVGEYDSSGALVKAYGWRPGSTWGTAPTFQLYDGNYYFYHNDRFGTPQEMTDMAGETVWRAEYEAFGRAHIVVDTLENNLRFPGQYYDEETGLHYNFHRYYDPETGRYVSEDPIGFAGGDANLYLYGSNNPLRFTDPYGLNLWDTLCDIMDGVVPGGFCIKDPMSPCAVAKDYISDADGDCIPDDKDPDDDNDGCPDDKDYAPTNPVFPEYYNPYAPDSPDNPYNPNRSPQRCSD